MRTNSYTINGKKTDNILSNNHQESLNQYTFQNSHYIYPNDVLICKKYKSFVTLLQVKGKQLSQYHNKKLSLVNRNHFIIKLKQIKKDEQNKKENFYHQYFLYYQSIPYSLSFVRMNELIIPLSSFKIEKALLQVLADLIQFNIFIELDLQKCGFTQQGQFRVYIPPLSVLNEKILTLSQKSRMSASINNILKFWQSDLLSIKKSNLQGISTQRASYRFNSPQMKKECQDNNQKEYIQSEQNTDIKKTIKLSKNYVKDLNNNSYDKQIHELKKHKSMGIINKQQQKQIKPSNSFVSKIDQLNKKLYNIREALINKKSTDYQSQNLANFVSRDKKYNNYNAVSYQDKDKYFQQIIFQENGKEYNKQDEQDRQSVDTYLQQIGLEYKMPKFMPNSQLRNTTLPTELQMIKNSLQGKDKLSNRSNSNWHHESAGNLAFKKFIQKNKDLLSNDGRSPTNLSKVSAPGYSQRRQSKGFQRQNSQHKLKKIVSLDNLQSQAETKSINLSQFSNELSTLKRRKEKQQKNQTIKNKIQDILIKSKKAIELLKNPIQKLKR